MYEKYFIKNKAGFERRSIVRRSPFLPLGHQPFKMDKFKDIQLGNEQVIMGLLWIMVTGALIWVMDNFLKKFENTMEDGFRKQARNINDSFRVNITLILMSLSVFGYYKYYLKKDTSHLTSLLDSLLDLLYSVGHFILYLLAYVVYGGYSLIGGEYTPGRPEPDPGVLLGFVVMFSYVVVKRLFFRKVPPLLWAVIVAGVMVGFNFFAKQTNFDPKSLFNNSTKKDKGDDNPNIENTDTITYNPQPRDNPPPPIAEKEEEDEDNIPQSYNADDIMIYKDKLLTAIENYDRLNQRTRPSQEDFIDNETGYINAGITHRNDMSRTGEHKAIVELVTDYKRKKLFRYSEMNAILVEDLCDYYTAYFDENVCPDVVYAN